MVGNNPRGSWVIPETSNFSELDRSEKARCHVPISAGLAPVGSQLASYNKRTALCRSPLGLSRWKQRLVSYSAGTHLRIRPYFPNIPTSSMKRYAGFIPCTSARLLRSGIKLGCSVPVCERSSRCSHPGKPEGELLSTGWHM